MATRTFLRAPGAVFVTCLVAAPWVATVFFLDGIRYLLVCYGGSHRQGWAGGFALGLPDELVESFLELTDGLAIQRAQHLAARTAGGEQSPTAHDPGGPREAQVGQVGPS